MSDSRVASEFHKQARQLDTQDNLASFRERFVISDPNLIYLDGNSLGRLPKAAANQIQHVVEHQWGSRLIRSWNEDWIQLSEHTGDKIASLLGASTGEIIIADSTSVNLYKLALSAILMQGGRHKIITDDMNFPSDLYILDSICRLLGGSYRIEIVPSPDEIYGPVDQLIKALDDDTALLCLSHTTFKSGYTYDMEALTSAAHEAGVLVLWDLSHSAGVVPIALNECLADLAIGCTYKYLNGGPGAPAFLYIRKDLQNELQNPISGWFGHQAAFDFDRKYVPADGIRRFLTGTPAILSISAIQTGIDILLEAGIDQIREKSVLLTQFLVEMWAKILGPRGFRLKSPQEPEWRGSHVTLGHDMAHQIALSLINDRNVIPDFREPDNIRLGFSPLFTSFEEVYWAVLHMGTVVDQKLYERQKPNKGLVT